MYNNIQLGLSFARKHTNFKNISKTFHNQQIKKMLTMLTKYYINLQSGCKPPLSPSSIKSNFNFLFYSQIQASYQKKKKNTITGREFPKFCGVFIYKRKKNSMALPSSP